MASKNETSVALSCRRPNPLLTTRPRLEDPTNPNAKQGCHWGSKGRELLKKGRRRLINNDLLGQPHAADASGGGA